MVMNRLVLVISCQKLKWLGKLDWVEYEMRNYDDDVGWDMRLWRRNHAEWRWWMDWDWMMLCEECVCIDDGFLGRNVCALWKMMSIDWCCTWWTAKSCHEEWLNVMCADAADVPWCAECAWWCGEKNVMKNLPNGWLGYGRIVDRMPHTIAANVCVDRYGKKSS